MTDGSSYDGVVELFLKDNWHRASCAISAYEGGVFISACALGVTRPFTMRMDIATFVKIADVLRQHLPDEDEGIEIEGCDEEMDLDDEIFARLDDLSEQVGQLQAEHVTPADMQRDRDWWEHLANRLDGVELKVAAASVRLRQVPGVVSRLANLEDRVKALEDPKSKLTANGNRSGGFYVTEYPSDLAARLINL